MFSTASGKVFANTIWSGVFGKVWPKLFRHMIPKTAFYFLHLNGFLLRSFPGSCPGFSPGSLQIFSIGTPFRPRRSSIWSSISSSEELHLELHFELIWSSISSSDPTTSKRYPDCVERFEQISTPFLKPYQQPYPPYAVCVTTPD